MRKMHSGGLFWIIAALVAAVCCFIIASRLLSFRHSADPETETPAASDPGIEKPAAAPTAEKPAADPAAAVNKTEPEGLQVKDLLETIGWLEASYDGLGLDIDESFFENGSSVRSLKLEGDLCGFRCSGYIIFARDYETKDMKADKVELTSDSSWDEMKQTFTERFGEPLDEGMIPYAQSQGGAIDWSLFKTKEGYVKLMQASEYDFAEIELYKTYYDR